MKNLKKKIINGFLLLLVGVSCIPSITVQAKTYNDTFNEKSQYIK